MIRKKKQITPADTGGVPFNSDELNNNPLVLKIFDDLPIGIIIYNKTSDEVLYSNKFFHRNSLNEKEIFSVITKYIVNSQGDIEYTNIGRDISVKSKGRRFSLGFSFYLVNDDTFFILLSEIASRTVFTNNKDANIFFDKLSELIAEIAHEIGNPLAGISMSLQVLLTNINKWPAKKSIDYISRTIQEMDRLSDFLKSIREVSRETNLKMVRLNLHDLVAKLFKQNSDLIKTKMIKVENKIDMNMEIYVDRNSFYQIILNLLNNSLYVLKPNQKLSFYIEEIDQLYIKLIFENNGDPIDKRIIDKIFSPFFTTKEKGEGLGLAISLKLMTRMGGTIKVETPENGIGVKFIVYIRNKTNLNG